MVNKIAMLENEITDRILGVANCYNDVTTSDLQGIAHVEAKNLIHDLKKFWNIKNKRIGE